MPIVAPLTLAGSRAAGSALGTAGAGGLALPGIGQIVGGVMLAKNVLDLLGGLFGGEDEPTWQEKLGPSPIHRNITPELQAMAERHRAARMAR